MRAISVSCATLAIMALCPACTGNVHGDEVYAAPTTAELRAGVESWLRTRPADADRDATIDGLWDSLAVDSSAEQRFDALLQTYYLADGHVRELVDACLAGDLHGVDEQLPTLLSSATNPLLAENLRYFVARYLAVLTMYDEALDQFQQIDVAMVVDPAGCLFYRAVCEHSLLLKEDGLRTIDTLLTSTQDVPVRYATVADLMKHDLELLRERTLGEVARQMRDVERRLTLGRAGPDVQRVEERIITTLDEIIEKIEQQQGGGGGGGGNGPRGGQQSNNPADESYVGGVQGPGEVEDRDIGHREGWGNLPDQAQAAAKEMINRQFPAHYRQAVEEYLKRIARRAAPDLD